MTSPEPPEDVASRSTPHAMADWREPGAGMSVPRPGAAQSRVACLGTAGVRIARPAASPCQEALDPQRAPGVRIGRERAIPEHEQLVVEQQEQMANTKPATATRGSLVETPAPSISMLTPSAIIGKQLRTGVRRMLLRPTSQRPRHDVDAGQEEEPDREGEAPRTAPRQGSPNSRRRGDRCPREEPP